jgi:hypothetical protein
VPGILYAYRYPQKVAVYVGVAQIADMPQGDRLSFKFALLSEARKRGNVKAISELEKIDPPPYASVADRLAIGAWVEQFGGAFHGKLILAAAQHR